MCKMTDLWVGYQKYQEQVLNRVAHSVGCEPSDLNDELVMDCFLNQLPVWDASRAVEHDLMQEVPF